MHLRRIHALGVIRDSHAASFHRSMSARLALNVTTSMRDQFYVARYDGLTDRSFQNALDTSRVAALKLMRRR